MMMSMDHPVPITLMHARSGSGRVVWSSAFDFEMSIIDRGGNNKEAFEELRARGGEKVGTRGVAWMVNVDRCSYLLLTKFFFLGKIRKCTVGHLPTHTGIHTVGAQ